MKLSTLKFSCIIVGLLIFSSLDLKAQISISGLSCTAAGGTSGYLYTISGNIDSADNISWDITGGIIAGSTDTSKSGTVSAIGTQIRIVWTAGVTNAQITLTDSRLGSATLAVSAVTINNTITSSQQVVDSGATVTITADSLFTSCIPLYDSWWESAATIDGPFTQIDGGTDQTLTINSVTQRAYYRRVLSITGDNIYSNTILVDVQ